MFEANINDNSVVIRDLQYPVIARYIKINPQRWNRFISLRVELYGCRFGSLNWFTIYDVMLHHMAESACYHTFYEMQRNSDSNDDKYYEVTIRPLSASKIVPYKVTKYWHTKAFNSVVRVG